MMGVADIVYVNGKASSGDIMEILHH